MERTLSSDLIFEDRSSTVGNSRPVRILSTLLMWQRRAVSRYQLARLDERLLADAGITLAEREAEVSKPFWH
ncbi:MAG: DUF1127 domain-containing protein [Pseudomonas sp.]|uniref:DUF1127 domain-containing protein n=1 Tax=Pseudomonas sp. TaxID=306 RepID=UPI003398D885